MSSEVVEAGSTLRMYYNEDTSCGCMCRIDSGASEFTKIECYMRCNSFNQCT